MCTHVHAQTIDKAGHQTIVQLSGLKPTMFASSVQAVVACSATALRVCTFHYTCTCTCCGQ